METLKVLVWIITTGQVFSYITNSGSCLRLGSSHVYSTRLDDVQVESKRLKKAKQLLHELTVENIDVTSISVIPKISDARNLDIATTIVPETYWSNGHLVGNNTNYVTRWARGVKVAEPLVRYDPVAAERLLFRQPGKWLVRNVQIAFPIGWWALGVVTDYVLGQSQKRRPARAQQLNAAISGLGPAIIKGGQALASRSDLLPSEYLEEMQKLQDDVPRFSTKIALATVEKELGVPFNQIFELVEEEPVAAASIGQVYKARLISNGDIVALKIMRPGCEDIIALDLYVLRWWSGIYNKIFEYLKRDIDVQSIIDDFGELIYREIDYIAEAANAQRFNELYAGVTDVFVPKIYSDLTTSKVLTMEWVDGFRLTDNASLAAYGLNRKKLVNTLVQCSLRQILENGFFHAGTSSSKTNLIFFNFNLTSPRHVGAKILMRGTYWRVLMVVFVTLILV
jgi:ABC1 atypical kinase-like domain